jgi:hypothetical protein
MGNTSSTNASPSSRGTNNEHHTATSLGHTLTGAATNLSTRLTNSPSLQLPTSFPFRSTGSLGLSKSELDAYCQPSGLYPHCEWDSKQIRRLIGDGRLAPRLKGSDSRCTKSDRECPICFMLYSQSNVTKCCEATICTECYLQIKKPKEKNTTCPFCNCPKMMVSVQKTMDEDAIAKREEEEQRVIESIIRNRVAQVNGEMPSPPVDESSFGSSLEQYNRSRTFSNSSSAFSEHSSDASIHSPIRPPRDEDLLSLAMSPDARIQLESEMAAQLSHETHRRVESEAEEARLRHLDEWSRTDSGMRSRMREARIAELTLLLEQMSRNEEARSELFSALEFGGGNNNNRGALENLMRLEAAFLNAEGRRTLRRAGSERFDGSPRRIVRMPRRGVSTTHMETAELLMRGVSEEEQLAMAIAMSMTEENERQQQQQNEQSVQTGDNNLTQSSTTGSEDRGVSRRESSSSDSSDSTRSETNEINNNGASTPSLDEDEEEVVFETE